MWMQFPGFKCQACIGSNLVFLMLVGTEPQGCGTCSALPAVTCLYVFNKRSRMKSLLFLLIFRA